MSSKFYTEMRVRSREPKRDEAQGLKLAPPWITYFNEIKAMFEQDPEIHITIDNGNNGSGSPTITLRIDSQAKYEAICRLLPSVKYFGNVEAHIILIPANERTMSDKALFEIAFKGNPVFSGTRTTENPYMPSFTYVVFKKEVVQFYNDDMQDPDGQKSTLYQDIAKDIFEEQDGIFYCTGKE